MTNSDIGRQFSDLIHAWQDGPKHPHARKIFERVLDDPNEPVRVIRNGDLQPHLQGKQDQAANKVNQDAVANMSILKYLAYCPTGLGEDAKGTQRYTRYTPDEDHPWGFTFDDLFRGTVAYQASTRLRQATSVIEKRKGGSGSMRKPAKADDIIRQYIQPSSDTFDRFQAEHEELASENQASQAVMALADEFHRRKKEGAKGANISHEAVYERVWKRTAFLSATSKYARVSRTQQGKGQPRISSRTQAIDVMDKLPPLDYKTISEIVKEIYARGLVAIPKVTTSVGENAFEELAALMPDKASLEQYLATLERDSDRMVEDINTGELEPGTDGGSAEHRYLERLKQCHAVMSIMPARMPYEISYTDALRELGMYKEDASGDDRYNDTRVIRDDKRPNAFRLKYFQVIGTFYIYSLAPIVAGVSFLLPCPWLLTGKSSLIYCRCLLRKALE